MIKQRKIIIENEYIFNVNFSRIFIIFIQIRTFHFYCSLPLPSSPPYPLFLSPPLSPLPFVSLRTLPPEKFYCFLFTNVIALRLNIFYTIQLSRLPDW